VPVLKRLRDLWKPEGLENVRASKDQKAVFQLLYEDSLVGILRLENGQWIFEYTPGFRAQKNVRPIIDFPDKAKKYVSDDLWPYFTSRIPALEQPSVQQVLDKEQVSAEDEVGLLRLFGKRTITNPFELKLVM